ncbi:MAG: radical SAM family heme chaperone HemW [Flexilinea sp.]|nr:radical SAM family heme chaperone HemW [Flexilinea sp.]
MDSVYSVYIHVPFCRTRCFYCDFNTFAGKDYLIPDYVNALCSEITRQKPYADVPVHSVYFGGGTPSRLSIADVTRIMETVRGTFRLTLDAEITFECNPCDVTAEYARGLADLGINRVSLGMQSAVPEELKRMGRRHTLEQTAEAIETLRSAGIRNINVDLIYGYPGQNMESWERSVRTAIELCVQHVSLYALSVEEGSALRKQLEMGRLTLPEEDVTVSMYELAARMLSDHGFRHYEISNWAVDEAYESRHNKQYWFVQPYYGFGAGAHGWINDRRIRNEGSIEAYIRKVNTSGERFPAAAENIPQDSHIEMQDVMMLGLRMLHEGITEQRFRERFGEEMRDVFCRELRHLERKNLVRWTPGGRLQLAPDKVMVANQAFIEFVD